MKVGQTQFTEQDFHCTRIVHSSRKRAVSPSAKPYHGNKGGDGRQRRARLIELKGKSLAFAVVNLLRYEESAIHHSQCRYDRNRQINSYDPAYGTADHYCEYREQRVNLEFMAHNARRNKIIHQHSP